MWKTRQKIVPKKRYKNMMCGALGLGPVDVVDVDEHDLEASAILIWDHSQSISKNYMNYSSGNFDKLTCKTCFLILKPIHFESVRELRGLFLPW